MLLRLRPSASYYIGQYTNEPSSENIAIQVRQRDAGDDDVTGSNPGCRSVTDDVTL